jgi:pilus assembly protein Flp/PilA
MQPLRLIIGTPALGRRRAVWLYLTAGCTLLMRNIFVHFIRSEAGVTAIEYSLIAGLISIVIITTASAIGIQIAVVFTGISAVLATP